MSEKISNSSLVTNGKIKTGVPSTAYKDNFSTIFGENDNSPLARAKRREAEEKANASKS